MIIGTMSHQMMPHQDEFSCTNHIYLCMYILHHSGAHFHSLEITISAAQAESTELHTYALACM